MDKTTIDEVYFDLYKIASGLTTTLAYLERCTDRLTGQCCVDVIQMFDTAGDAIKLSNDKLQAVLSMLDNKIL